MDKVNLQLEHFFFSFSFSFFFFSSYTLSVFSFSSPSSLLFFSSLSIFLSSLFLSSPLSISLSLLCILSPIPFPTTTPLLVVIQLHFSLSSLNSRVSCLICVFKFSTFFCTTNMVCVDFSVKSSILPILSWDTGSNSWSC